MGVPHFAETAQKPYAEQGRLGRTWATHGFCNAVEAPELLEAYNTKFINSPPDL